MTQGRKKSVVIIYDNTSNNSINTNKYLLQYYERLNIKAGLYDVSQHYNQGENKASAYVKDALVMARDGVYDLCTSTSINLSTSVDIPMIINILSYLGIRKTSNPLSFAAGKEYISATSDRGYATTKIIEAVCTTMDIGIEKLYTKNRKREICQARQLVYYFLERFLKGRVTLAQMGLIFGQNHATVLHGKRSIINLVSLYDEWEEIVNEISIKIQIELNGEIYIPESNIIKD